MPWRARTSSPYRADRPGAPAFHPQPDAGSGDALLGPQTGWVFPNESFRGVQSLLSAVERPQASTPESPPP